MRSVQELQEIASQVRRDIIRMTNLAKSGHPGGSLGSADYFTALYFSIMKHDPGFNMKGEGEDVFILSNGHLSPAFYSVLARSGYFGIQELSTFRRIGSRLQGHPSVMEDLPGIRVATGSLGQGLSVTIGIALSKKLKQDERLVYCLAGDGELQEGQVWEAAMFAAAHKVDNLILAIDYNQKQIDGPVDEVLSLGDLHAKWKAFGWQVHEMNGNDMQDILDTLENVHTRVLKGQPIVILMHTEMGCGVDFMTGTHKWHGVPPNDEQAVLALGQLKETLGDF